METDEVAILYLGLLYVSTSMRLMSSMQDM